MRPREPRPRAPLTTQMSARMAKTSEDQCTKPDEVWCAKMAQSDHAIAIEAGRSPSGVEKAYVAAVPSRKNLYVKS